jgi:hypothetical protein
MTDTTAATPEQSQAGTPPPPAQPLLMRDLLDPTILGQSVEAAKLDHYRMRFASIIGTSGLTDRPIERVSFAQIVSAALRQRPLRLWLPGLDDSQYSIPAAIFTIYWAVWRKVAFAWLLAALWLAVIAGDVLMKQALGVSLILIAYVPIALGFGVFGNSLLLYQIVREARADAIRRDPTSILGVIAAIILVGGAAGVSLLYEDRAAARDCGSRSARELVISIARRHYEPLITARALERIELGNIRQRQLIGETQHCVAEITLRAPNGELVAEAEPIAYTLELTADRSLYATVTGLP